MKSYLSSVEAFNQVIKPSEEPNKFDQTISPYLPFKTQVEFSKFLSDCQFEETGDVSTNELQAIKNIKRELKDLFDASDGNIIDRLEFDISIIFHRNLKKIGWGRYLLDDIGMWRYMALNYFKEEAFYRRGKSFFDKKDFIRAAKVTFDHCFGPRVRDIFPRRYFLIGERLYDKNKGYSVLEKLSEVSKNAKEGGFGNLIANLIETNLLSPHDYVSKVMAKVLFLDQPIANDKEVSKAFVRYNGFKTRLLNSAHESIFKEEICLKDTKTK